MAIRNPWILVAAVLIMTAIMAVGVFGGGAIPLSFFTRPETTNVLQVPGKYATIQAAVNAASEGDIIEVAPGTYDENITLNKAVTLTAGTFDQVNAANNATVLDGGNSDWTILIPAGLTQMPTIQGFVVRNSKDGIEAHSEFIAQNNYFYGSQWSVEYQSGAGGINRSNVYFNSANDSIHVTDLTAALLVENNRFMYAGDDAIEVDLQGSPSVSTVVEMDILNNMLLGSGQDGVKFVDYPSDPLDTNRRISIAGNLLANNRRAGIGFMHSGNTNEDYSGADTAEAVRAYNNTFYGNDYGVSGGDNLVAFNNIIANSISHAAWRVQGAPGANSVVAYTLFWRNGVDTDQTTLGIGNLLGQDPLFVAAPGPGPDGAWGTVDDDFSGLLLQPGSPAIDKGVTQYVAANGEAVPPTPLTGFIGAAPDLGWREVGGAIFNTPTATLSPTATSQGTATAEPSVTPTVTGTPAATDTPPAASPTAGAPTLPSPTAAPASPTAAATGTPNATTAPAPTIQGVSPTSAQAGDTLALIVVGTGFQTGATASLEGAAGTAPQVTAVQVVSSTQMVVTIQVPDAVPETEMWDLLIAIPDGATAVLKNALTIRP